MSALRILHVEDEAALSTVFQLILEGTGRYVVRDEACGDNAVAAAREFHPDVILLDKQIAGVDGESVAAELQKEPSLRDVPIGFVTGGLTRAEAAEEPMPTLQKPASPRELVEFVDDLLS